MPTSRAVCIVAPFGQDAKSIATVLLGHGLKPVVYTDLNALALAIGDEVGVVVLAEESLMGDTSALQRAFLAQPTWSDVPVVLLRAPRSPIGGRPISLPDEVINVVELERPMSSASLISAVDSALRARFKQFVLRDQVISLERSQNALAESESELRLIADSLPVLIAFVDADLVYRFVNLAYEDWFNVPIAKILGRKVEDVVGPLVWEQRKGDIERALAGHTIRAEVNWPTPEGRRRDAEVRYIPRFDKKGNVDGFHVFAADVTERKVVLELTQKQAALLEIRVAERTAELEAEMAARKSSEEALRQSQKMEAVGQLTGGIAHDFNNMLMGIVSAMELMRLKVGKGDIEGLSRLIDLASSSAERAAGLTQRLLAFSRRQSLDPRPVDVGALVHSMEDLLRRTLGERIRLSTSVDEDIPLAMVDANQLESALLNLAINARDAMPDGGELRVSLSVEASPDDEAEEPYIVMAVTDTGIGMDEVTQQKIFEPFFTTKPLGHGTGLGMSMIYGFVNQSKGHIRVTSAVGKGTTVRLYLPLSHAVDSPKEVERRGLKGGEGQRVLVVDDDPQVRALVSELIRELGYCVESADSAETAIGTLDFGHPFDLLVTDVGLPGLNGRQLADIIRQSQPELPVLFMTGYAQNATTQSEFLGKNMQMVAKPFSMGALSEAVGSMLAGRSTH